MPKKWNLNSKIISALRRIWLYSPQRSDAKKRSKCGKDYACERCQQIFSSILIHHKTPCKPEYRIDKIDWNLFIDRLFCPSDELLCVCNRCHKEIHNAD